MAFNTNELFSSATRAAFPRAQPFQHGIQPKTLAITGGGAVALAFLSPMAVVTASGQWVLWANGGADGSEIIRGFLWEPDGISTDDDEEVLANIFLRGVIHLDDIPVVGGTLAQLKAALQTGVRERGLIIDGLELQR